MRTPLVSVIIPCYNAANWATQAVHSCLSQSYPSIEIVAVDDGSTDETLSVLQRAAAAHTNRIKVVGKPNGGSSSARNAGIDASSGEYLIFLDADDVLVENAIDRLVDVMLAERADAAVGAWCSFHDGSGRCDPPILIKPLPLDPYATCVRRLATHSAFLFPRESLHWNENRVIWEGLEYVLNFFETERKLAYTDAVVVHVRQHSSADRISVRYDHFEPLETGCFFVDQKARLQSKGLLSPTRESVLDEKVAVNAYALIRQKRFGDADHLLASVNWSALPTYDWYRNLSFAGASHWLGPRFGSRAFYCVNHWLGRT